MEPEQTNNKKIVGMVGALLVLVAGALFFLINPEKAPEKGEAPPPPSPEVVVTPPRVYTEAERMQILADIATQQKNATSQVKDIKTLQNLSKQTPKDTTSTEDKLKILQSLSTQPK